jgi:uncharacterized protein (DUF849 family)
VRQRCLRVLVELPDRPYDEARAERLLRRVGDSVPVLLHGEGVSAWPALRAAAGLGLDTRVGLEDVLVLPDGSPAPANAALVGAALAVLGRANAAVADRHDVLPDG